MPLAQTPSIRLQTVLFSLIALALSACGGGGGGGGDPVDGQLTGWMVEGLRYESGRKSGEIDDTGAFVFESGEQVSFKIGDVVIGRTAGRQDLSIPEICGADLPVTRPRAERAIRHDRKFWHLTNVATLLALIDEDGDATNGIVIPSEVHDLLSGVSMPFYLSPFSFQSHLTIRTLRKQALDANIWNESHRLLPQVAPTLDALYTGMQVPTHFFRITQRDIDYNAGPLLDIDESQRYTFDPQGRLTMLFRDNDGDGVYETVNETTYDASGLVTMRTFRDNNGTLARREVYTHDLNGNQTMRSTDSNGDGNTNQIFQQTWDDYSNPMLETTDSDNDGNTDRVTTREYNARGVPIRSVLEVFNSVGTLTWRTTSYHDALGHPTSRTVESPIGSAPVTSSLSQYDAHRNLLDQRLDFGPDGQFDSRSVMTYSALDQLLSRRTDSDNDGTFDTERTYRYRADGQWDRSAYTKPPVGGTALTEGRRFDARGNMIESYSVEGDFLGHQSTFDVRDNELTRTKYDGGEPDLTVTWTYNPAFMPTSKRIESVENEVEATTYGAESASWWTIVESTQQ